ncbi:MAG: hypothetical protein J2P54_23070 [Bradyrhizobiaceae bacterium]|nr:hypothetical protein [Bradyrhizobiaceae bacterium]
MRPDNTLGNPEHLGHFRHTADFDDGEQDAKLRLGQVELFDDRLRWGGQIERRLADQHGTPDIRRRIT